MREHRVLILIAMLFAVGAIMNWAVIWSNGCMPVDTPILIDPTFARCPLTATTKLTVLADRIKIGNYIASIGDLIMTEATIMLFAQMLTDLIKRLSK